MKKELEKELINSNVIVLTEIRESSEDGDWHGYQITINGYAIDRYTSRAHATHAHRNLVAALNPNA